jgi:hypothetical protein
MADEIAYRELQPGEVIQAGDEWQAKQGTGAWHEYHPSMYGLETLASSIARRPYNITQIIGQRDKALAELSRLQQSQAAADHFAGADKMVETELERKAWELYSRLDLGESAAFDQAQVFLAERDRRRTAGDHDAN